jgi:hypothetical protein
MADLLSTADGVMARFLEDPQTSRAALAFMAGSPFGRRRKRKGSPA